MVDLGFNDTHGPPHRRTASDHASQESRAAHQPWLSSFFELSSWERVARSTLFHCHWLKRASVRSAREVYTVLSTCAPRLCVDLPPRAPVVVVARPSDDVMSDDARAAPPRPRPPARRAAICYSHVHAASFVTTITTGISATVQVPGVERRTVARARAADASADARDADARATCARSQALRAALLHHLIGKSLSSP